MSLIAFQKDGYVITAPLFDQTRIVDLDNAVSCLDVGMAGTRNLLTLPWCASLADEIRQHPAIAPYIDRSHVAVQCTYFEKSSERNWLVPLHQDPAIPVAERIEHPELSGWSMKEGTLFVHPPASVLEEVVAVRLHIDDCGLDDGPLRVVPGSHTSGRRSNDDAVALRDRDGEVTCAVACGGALVMRPLLLHASSKAKGNSRRRVLHFLYGPPVLPYGLLWCMAV